MFCKNCGAELQENAKFCPKCGTLVAEKPQAGAGTPATNDLTAKPSAFSADAAAQRAGFAARGNRGAVGTKATPKMLRLLAIAAVALVAIIVFVNVLKGGGSGFGSPEEAFEAYYNGMVQQDYDRSLKAMPDFVIAYLGGEDGAKAYLQQSYRDSYQQYIENGDQITYKAPGSMEADSAIDIIEPDLNNWFGTDVKLDGLAEVKYEFIAQNEDTGTDYSDSGYTEYGIKYKGKWYFVDYLSGM